MREVVIIGVGSTSYGKQPRKSVVELGCEAVKGAIKDAGIKGREIQFAYASTVFGNAVLGERVLSQLGISGIEVFNVENACAGGK